MDDLRKEKRAPILLKVKYKSASVDEFVQQSGLDISRGGIFIKTKTPMDIGTVLKFEFQLNDGAPVIQGVGRVAWRREMTVATRDLPPGMGLKFIKLDPESRTTVDRIASERGASPSRYDAGDEEISGPHPTASVAEAAAPPAAPAPPRASAPPVVPPDRPAAAAPKPTTAPKPAPPGAKPPAGLRAAPPGVFSGPAKGPPARARESTGGRPTVPSADPIGAASPPDSFFPKGPPSASPAKEDSTQVRHVSEFLASVMNDSGASDRTVAAEAQATAAKARVREHEVEEQRLGALEAQLFGDMGEQTVSVPLRTHSLSPNSSLEKDFDPFASEPPSASPEFAAPSAKPTSISPMQRSLAPSSRESETGRQQGFGAAQASAAEAKFPVPEVMAPLGAAQGNVAALHSTHASLPPPKSSSSVLLPLVVVAALLGGGGYWYFQLGGAQTIAGGPAPITQDVTPQPPARPPEPTPAPVAAPPTAAEPVAEPTPAPEPPPAVEQAPVAMSEVEITSLPKAATLTIDGVAQGTTPKHVALAVGSTANIAVSAVGHKPTTQAYTVTGRNDVVRFKLETMNYVLTVRTVPSDAHVNARNISGDNAQPMDLGFLSDAITINVTKSGFTAKQKRVTPDMFVEQNGVMVAEIEVGLQRPSGGGGPAPAPSVTPAPPTAPDPAPRPAPVTATAPEPERAPRPAPRPAPKPAPALPDNPF